MPGCMIHVTYVQAEVSVVACKLVSMLLVVDKYLMVQSFKLSRSRPGANLGLLQLEKTSEVCVEVMPFSKNN